MRMRTEFVTASVSDGLSKDSFDTHFVKELSANLHLQIGPDLVKHEAMHLSMFLFSKTLNCVN